MTRVVILTTCPQLPWPVHRTDGRHGACVSRVLGCLSSLASIPLLGIERGLSALVGRTQDYRNLSPAQSQKSATWPQATSSSYSCPHFCFMAHAPRGHTQAIVRQPGTSLSPYRDVCSSHNHQARED